MVYLVNEYYLPNSAEFNRMMSFVKGFKEEGVAVKVVYIVEPEDLSSLPGDTIILNHKGTGIIGKIQNITKTNAFIKSLNDGDSVIFLTTTWCMLYPLLKRSYKKKGIKLYHEQTEYPPVLRQDNSLNRFLYRLYYRACLYLDGLFVISESLKDLFVSKGIHPSKIFIVNITVDPSRFENLKKGECTDYVAYCGTVSIGKDGVSDLINAYYRVAKLFPTVKLYIIGRCNNKEDAECIQALIKELDLLDSIVLTGMVHYTEMPQLLFNAKALLLSRPDNVQAKYGFPTKLGEYLLTGNPVVVTKVGDIPLFLREGVDAYIVAPGNYVEFADSIIRILSNPEEARRIGESGKKVAQMCFNYKTEASKIIEALRI